MNTQETVELLAGIVEWQAAEVYVTNKGKRKPILTGVPTRNFWHFWKVNKQEIRNAGITLDFEKVHATRETATGRAAKSGGSYKPARAGKRWRVVAWLGGANGALADLTKLGWPEVQEDEGEAVPTAFIATIEEEDTCPF